MTLARTAIQDFSTSNKIYAGATVTAHTVVSGAKTSVKADLYSTISGAIKVSNPQVLDSFGRLRQPVYIEQPVILTVTGLKNTPDHDTGIITVPSITSGTGTPEGVVTANVGALFTRTDGGVGTTLYVKETGTDSSGWRAV